MDNRVVNVSDIVSTERLASMLGVGPKTVHAWRTRYSDMPKPVYRHPLLTLWDSLEVRAWRRRRWPKERAQAVMHEVCPRPPGHPTGTRSAYTQGCRCPDSRKANREYHAAYYNRPDGDDFKIKGWNRPYHGHPHIKKGHSHEGGELPHFHDQIEKNGAH